MAKGEKMKFKKNSDRFFYHLLSAPLIYSLIVPFIILDFFVEIYHQICFRLYGLALIKRSEYIKIDRHKLHYLDFLDKIHCVYCGYVNGLIKYVSVVAGETEKYWCGIKHQHNNKFHAPDHHKDFLEYGDVDAFHEYANQENEVVVKTEK